MREFSRRAGRLKTLCVAACAGVSVGAVTSPVRAEVAVALSWRPDSARADVCVTEAPLREAVEEKLGRKPFVDHEHAQIVIQGEEFAIGRDRFRARVIERDRRGVVLGVRELEAQSCPSLQRAAKLIVALIIDPYFKGRRVADDAPVTPPPARQANVATKPSPPPTLAPLPPRARAPLTPLRRPAFDFSLGLGAGSSVGVLPSASATLFVVARLEPARSRWSFDWRGGYSLPQRLRDGPVLGDFSAVEQHVRSCLTFVEWPSRKLDACGGIVGTAVMPSTSGVDQGTAQWKVLLSPTAAVAFEQRAGAAFGRLELGVMLPLRQYAFSYFDLANERKGFYSTEAVIFFFALSGFGRIP